jgi:hypothetical protein
MKKSIVKNSELKGSKPSQLESDSKQNSSTISNLFKRIENQRKFAL